MHNHDKTHDGATCDASFHPFGPDSETPAKPASVPSLPNPSALGIVTLAADGTFVSSRLLTQEELAAEWAAHHARHGGG